MAAPIEPSACAGSFSTEANGLHYLWRGAAGPAQVKQTVAIYDSRTELWTLRPTTGSPPPGLYDGGCVVVENHLYCFGGNDGCSPSNSLHKLDCNSHQWTKVNTKNHKSECPIQKASFDLISIYANTLACFGGFGVGDIQTGSAFTKSTVHTDGRGWTNEFHLFDILEGVWSSPEVKGERPPPCSAFSFTKTDQHKAVLFGGRQPYCGRVNDLYMLDFKNNIEVTKAEELQGESWPQGRSGHAACCLNFGQNNPMLLVSGGLSKEDKVLGDFWILDVDCGKWTEVTSPQSLKPRYWHSMTATCLGIGLTEVLVFGGRLDWSRKLPVSETTILKFECLSETSETGLRTEKWALKDVALNNTRGSHQRIREKENTRLEQQLQLAEQRAQNAEQKAADALLQKRDTEVRLAEANRICIDTKRLLSVSEDRNREVLQMSQEIKRQAMETERKLATDVDRLQRIESRAQLAENRLANEVCQKEYLQSQLEEANQLHVSVAQQQQATRHSLEDVLHQKEAIERELEGKTRELAAHNTEVWRIPSSKVNTIKTIGTGGWGEVLEGTVRVAVKRLHVAILSTRNLERLQREMRLLAEVRHPNLVQFIGAVFNQSPSLIVTELLDVNLRQAYEQNLLAPGNRLAVFVDIARALDYLHQRYEPIIHRDVSAPNVLLQRMPDNQWKGKVSDLGSANFLKDSVTMGEGAMVYSPPEVIPQPSNADHEQPEHSVKIDVYSYGIVLCEVCTSRFPTAEHYREMILQVQREHPRVHALIVECTKRDPSDRPSMAEVLVELNTVALP